MAIASSPKNETAGEQRDSRQGPADTIDIMAVRSWKLHGSRLALGITLLVLAGWLADAVWLVLIVAFLAFVAWHLVNLVWLHRWLRGPGREPPESLGIWADIFDGINALDQQNHQQGAAYRHMIGEFQNLTNAFPDATLVIDQHDTITWCNDAAVALLGLRLPGDLGQAVTNLVRGPAFAEWLAVQASFNSRLEMPSPADDNQWLQVTAVPFQDTQRLVILRNITDLHNVEQMRRDFVANISHELRTPVTVLTGYLELLREHPARDIADPVERMHAQTLQMRALLDDLLELSRVQGDIIRGLDEEVDIAALLRQLEEQAQEVSQGRHQFRFEADPYLRLNGMANDLASAFRNLIVNAIRYTPEAGKIEVRWSDSPEGPRLSVKDNGPGIARRHIPRLTERFYRVSTDRARQSGGTGLGLAIVKHVMNAHRARLLIHSELGEGSEFICLFPPERRILKLPETSAQAT